LHYIDAVRFLPDAIFVVTSDGFVLDANLAGRETIGRHTIDSPLALDTLVECPRDELLSRLQLWSRNRSPVPGKLVWRTPAGPQPYRLNAWCARPATESRPAWIILRCDSEIASPSRFLILNQQLGQLRSEINARQQTEARLTETIAARDDFVAVAAHELRNPLNVFHLTLQLLYRVAENPGADVRGILRKLKVQLDRIISLVDRLLDVGRIRSGKFELEREPVNLGELAREIVDRFSDLHPDVPLALRLESQPDGWWDRLRLDQAISNIIANALKYGMRKPIEVTVGTTSDSFAFVSVKDQGIGLMPGDIDRIFDRFERAVPLSSVEGLGLGLWIAKRVLEAHGGAISAEGQPGRGAVFTVRLPLASETR
jgi:signal transduction histidine kinase